MVMYITVRLIFSIANGDVARFLRNQTVAGFNVMQKETESKQLSDTAAELLSYNKTHWYCQLLEEAFSSVICPISCFEVNFTLTEVLIGHLLDPF
jgi:hypothetical protein